MSGQHRATPQQWKDHEKWGRRSLDPDPDSSCILELRARVEALEAAHRQSAMDELRPAIKSQPADGGLVNRVADSIASEAGSCHSEIEARAAIREVAAAAKDLRFTTAKALIAWLEREANQ